MVKSRWEKKREEILRLLAFQSRKQYQSTKDSKTKKKNKNLKKDNKPNPIKRTRKSSD